jgi:M6 family metalloprotease-like protein
VKITYRRTNKLYVKDIQLAADDSESSLPPEEKRVLTTWKKPSFKLAVICIEFPDARHSEKIPLNEWDKAFFSRGTYNKTSATGQQVYGSMADYYHEVSCGKFHISGRTFAWTGASKKRMEYNLPSRSKSKGEFFTEIVKALCQREGEDSLKDFDGLAFIYAGVKPAEVLRSSILWPHRSSVKIGEKLWPYVIVPEASTLNGSGEVMSNISTMCHEFGHVLGLPDLYARPENPGSEGAGVWTVMSNQIRNGRPQHFCAWSKEQLGWLNPVVVDPTVKQKLIFGPVEGSDHECLKILVRPDGSEYFLLENRRKTGFDASLPAEGLLIWRVVANRPILEESHGVEGPAGPRVFVRSVPFPSKQNESFTPYTTPSSRSQMGGGLPVHITNIRQLPDERISFEIGYEFD